MQRRLKIGIWILSDYKQQTGGGFSLYDKTIQLIDGFNFSDDVEVCFVGHLPRTRFKFKREYICVYPFGIASGIITKFSHKSEFIGRLEGNILKKNNVDFIYYPVQGFKKVNNFPFVVANWDIGHLSNFAFPEIALNGKFEL